MDHKKKRREYYKQKLQELKNQGAAFAKKHPQVANALHLSEKQPQDPSLKNFIESFADLLAGLQTNLDQEDSQWNAELQNTLFPQLQLPIPSMNIVQFFSKQETTSLETLVEKDTLLEVIDQNEDQQCIFKTVYSVPILPLSIIDVQFSQENPYPFFDGFVGVDSTLKIKIEKSTPTAWAELSMKSLRFCLADGDPMMTFPLYELIASHIVKAAFSSSSSSSPHFLPTKALQPVGFKKEKSHQLLIEYFTFPEKFLFFDLQGMDWELCREDNEVELFFAFNKTLRSPLDLTPQNFRLHCTPVINLYPQSADPLEATGLESELPLIPDRRAHLTKVYQLQELQDREDADTPSQLVLPYFSHLENTENLYWHLRKESSPSQDSPLSLLTFLDLDRERLFSKSHFLEPQVSCFNPELSSYVIKKTRLEPLASNHSFQAICLLNSTRPIFPQVKGKSLWQSASHFSLNRFGLLGEDPLGKLQELLHLYNLPQDPVNQKQIQGLQAFRSYPTKVRVGKEAWKGFIQGTEIHLDVAEENFVGSSIFLFGEILVRLLGASCGLNHFVKLKLQVSRTQQVLYEWPPISGSQFLSENQFL